MDQRVHQFKLPMRIQTSRKKKTALNLNVYRNLHFRSLSAQKNLFHEIMVKLLRDLPPLGRIHLHYDICPRTKVRLDIMNVGSIVDKYFSDSLVELDKIEDDNHHFINRVSFGFGGLVKDEHVLVTITEIEPRKGNAMRILLDEDEIQAALETFVGTLGLADVTGVSMDCDETGNITAEVLFGVAKTSAPKTPRKSKGGRPAGSKNKTKEPADVESTAEDGDGNDSSGAAEPTEAEEPATTAEETPAAKPTKAAGNTKNLFGESPEESSPEADSDSPETKEGDSAPKVKPPSIFDQ